MGDEPSNITEFRKEQQESVIAFKLGPSGVPRFLQRTGTVADSFALFAFARQIADQEIARLTLESLNPARAAKTAG